MTFTNPPKDCGLCPRLSQFRWQNRAQHPTFHNAPVDAFGDLNAELLVVGLAPGLKGANATARPFTGDYAGDVLYPALKQAGFAHGHYAQHAGDGFHLINCRITNAVRCVPPENKPTTEEMRTCRPFLVKEMAAMPNLKALLCLGHIAHQAVVRTLEAKLSATPFGHGAMHQLYSMTHKRDLTLVNSYHCSRYNINTNRLTRQMFDDVLSQMQLKLSLRNAS